MADTQRSDEFKELFKLLDTLQSKLEKLFWNQPYKDLALAPVQTHQPEQPLRWIIRWTNQNFEVCSTDECDTPEEAIAAAKALFGG